MTRVEFYKSGVRDRMVEAVESAAVPRAGEFVNIRGETWQVDRVTWALDYPDERANRCLRANVEMTLV